MLRFPYTSHSSVSDLYSDLDPAVAAQLQAAQDAIKSQFDNVLANWQAQASAAIDSLAANTQSSLSNLTNNFGLGNVSMGNIIIQGNADESTVSEIRRAQRDNLNTMLSSLNTLYSR